MGDKKANNGLLTVNEFAKYSRTTKDTLLHYDRIGLLHPIERGENNYRRYSTWQLATVRMIHTFQELGMSLSEIKKLSEQRSPELVYDVLTQQIDRIDSKINEWVSAKKLLFTLRSLIDYASIIDEHSISIQFMPAEAIVLGGLNDYSMGRDNYDALLEFYSTIQERFTEIDLSYPTCGLFSKESVENGDWLYPDRYYFFNPYGYDKKPSALYAIGYSRGGYSHYSDLFERIIEYIDRNNFEICGNAYEEYLLNELCIADEKNYLVRVMIMVQEKA